MNFNQMSPRFSATATPVNLSDIVSDVPVVQGFGPHDASVAGVTTDSRRVRDRWLFVAVEGAQVDGHVFVQRAIENGAGCVVVQRKQFLAGLNSLLTAAYAQHNECAVLVVEDSRIALALLADRFYGSPSKSLKMVGITGTNGKTTTAFLISSILEAAGMRTGMLGTIEYRLGRNVVPASLTTPPAEELHEMFATMLRNGCRAAVMEVSSHSLALGRVLGVAFDVSIFTNLTRDHLDFHTDMNEYAAAKSLLFTKHTRGIAILNSDDPASADMHSKRGGTKRYGVHGRPAFRIVEVTETKRGMTVVVEHNGERHMISSHLTGGFNAYNITAAFAAGISLGIEPETVLRGIKRLRAVPGRFERITSVDGVTAVVDYSHTPDSLLNALKAVRALPVLKGRIITVFGCGGDRDHGKRPMMGGVASENSDVVVVTSDNPRTEDPNRIIEDILAGTTGGAKIEVRVKREAAIRHAVKMAAPGDIVLIAGKGHETYQILGKRKIDFDDHEVVRRCFDELHGGVKK